MTAYQRFVFPFLRQLDPERAHDWTLRALEEAQWSRTGRFLLRFLAGRLPGRTETVFGLAFPNVLGVAAGYDKNGQAPLALALLGFGHVEVGTVTPWSQRGNIRPRIFRLPQDRALINRMGFPNDGMARVTARLRQLKEESLANSQPFVLGVSMGKQKETPLADAANDYLKVMRAVHPFADYLAINISSPNTPGLRQLQGRAYLEQLLKELKVENARLAAQTRRPMLVKIAPDLSWEEIDQILQAAEATGIDGIIATNTTVERTALREKQRRESGGLSGQPLAERSLDIVRYVCSRMGERMPVIAVGGVATAADVRQRLDAGAKLVQLYTALVYEGPRLPGRLLNELERKPG